MPVIETLVDGLDHPEGVAYDPRAGVVWAGGEAGQLYRVDLESRTWEEAARAPGFVLGVAIDGRGRVVSAARARGRSACSTTGGCARCTTACAARTTPRSPPTGRCTSPTRGRGRRTTGALHYPERWAVDA